jgi:hypothetical protein
MKIQATDIKPGQTVKIMGQVHVVDVNVKTGETTRRLYFDDGQVWVCFDYEIMEIV